MFEENQENRYLEHQMQWEHEKIIYFGQILGIIQILLTIVCILFFSIITYMYFNFRISDFFQSIVIINIVIVLAISFVALVIIFLIMYIKTFVSCIFVIKRTEDTKKKKIFIFILLLPAFFTFYYRNAFNLKYSKKIKVSKKQSKVIKNDENDSIENQATNHIF